jgi:choline dehydrogenase
MAEAVTARVGSDGPFDKLIGKIRSIRRRTNAVAMPGGNMPETFDYIVAGAGSAGCVIAARLSENPKHRVLLLEAGPKDTSPWIHMPMGYAKLFAHPKLNWMYESEPEPELNNRTMYQPRGKVLGGTSSINGMVYMRGNPADYDEWRQRGCTGWDCDPPLFQESRGSGTRPQRGARRRRPAACQRPPGALEARRTFCRRRDRGRASRQ